MTQIRPRVVWTALIGVIVVTLFVQWSDIQVGGTMSAGPFPPLAASLLWALLLGGDRLMRRLGKRPLFAPGEMLILLAMWVAANMVAGRGLLYPLLTSIAGPIYYARGALITGAVGAHLPDWLALTGKAAARPFFEGYGFPAPWRVWQRPLLTWSLFLFCFLTANVCLCALFERIWVRHERLAYPLVALPIEAVRAEMRRGDNRLFVRAILLGLAAPLLLHGFGAAHAYLPAIPCVPFYNDVSDLAATAPWTVLKPLYLNLYPLLIGLTFLAPTDVTFSVWFFLLLNKAELVVTAAAGWNEGPTGGAVAGPPFLEEQSAGAYLTLAAVIIANARGPLRQILFGGGDPEGGVLPSERKVHRLLLLGLLASLLGLLLWFVWTGIPLWFSLAYVGFYLAAALVLSRLMAEGGVSWLLAPILPDKLILSLFGSQSLAPVAITRLMLHTQHLRDTRQMLAPAIFQAGKLRDAAAAPPRGFYGLLLGSLCLALLVGGAVALPLFYHHGALSLAPTNDGLMMTAVVIPTTAVGQATTRLSTPIRPSVGPALAIIAGAAVTWGMAMLHSRCYWWPLHPLGYALTGTLQVGYANKMVLSIFLGWVFKSLTIRLGGSRGFRLMRGAALGLICGDLLMGGVLKLLDVLLGPSGYAIF